MSPDVIITKGDTAPLYFDILHSAPYSSFNPTANSFPLAP